MKKILFILTFVLFYGLGYSQDLVPENTGYGYERLTTAQLNALPKKKVGDIYYNNDLGYHVKWNGTIFQSLASGVSGIDPADQNKLNNISITQPVNLDTVESLANSALQTETDPTTTPANLKSKLESLTAENRLDASAIKNLPTGDVTSVNGQTGVVTLVKGDVGLGNADNTSDLNKPISTATQTALDNKINVNPVSPTQWIAIAGGTQAELDAADLLGNTPVGGTTFAFPTDLSATTDGMIEDFNMSIVGTDTLQFTANYPSPMPDIIRKVKLPSENYVIKGENIITSTFTVKNSDGAGLSITNGNGGATNISGGIFPSDRTELIVSSNSIEALGYSNADITALGDRAVITKSYADANYGGGDDSGTTGLVLQGESGGTYTVASQEWIWSKSGKNVTFHIELNSIDGTSPTGQFQIDVSGTTFPTPKASTDFFFNTITKNFPISFASIISGFSTTTPVIRFWVQTAIDGSNNTMVSDIDFSGTNSIIISGTYITN